MAPQRPAEGQSNDFSFDPERREIICQMTLYRHRIEQARIAARFDVPLVIWVHVLILDSLHRANVHLMGDLIGPRRE